MASISVTSTTTNSITVYVSGLGTTATYIEFYKNGSSTADKLYTLSARSQSHTYVGLSPGTAYTLSAVVYNSSWQVMTFAQNSVTATTKAESKITIIYRDGASSETTAAATSHTARGPFRSDMTFLGWATSTSSPSIAYSQGSTIRAGSSNSTLTLYAVYQNASTFDCYYIQGNTGDVVSNSREKIQYRCNISNTTSSTNFYNNVTLPTFGSTNATINTTTPTRSWSAAGWKMGTSAGEPDYSAGQSVATNYITGNLYAIYSNECSITYNSNGGSGSMSKVSDIAYYHTLGGYTTPTLRIGDCSFTAPSGLQFDHWNVKSDDSGTKYLAGGTVSTNYNPIFYAIWVIKKPDKWQWTSNVSKGAAVPYTQSGDTITAKPLTAAEWLAFVDRIEEFTEYLGLTVDSTYLYRATNGVSKGSPMTTTQANAVRYLINQLNPPIAVPASVSSGDRITAMFINGLKDSLNSIE